METESFNQVEFKNAYGILCHSVTSQNLWDALYPTFCQISENGQTQPHAHFEPEIFFILNGHGLMSINEESKVVSAGDLVRIPSYATHTLKNMSNFPLEFLSIYSNDQTVPKSPEQTLITVAPPTPNGPLHLGHISGPYLASDIVSRHLRAQGKSTHTHSGTDDNQNYVSEKAMASGQDLEIFKKSRRARIKNGLRHLKIEFNEFVEPSTETAYQQKIQNFAKRAIQSKVIEMERQPMPRCQSCDVSLVDCLADGVCPNCLSNSSGGCETCGIVVSPDELHNIQCGRCGSRAQLVEMDVYNFNLGRYLPAIEEELNSKNLPPRIKGMIQNVRNQKISKVLVAYPTTDQTGIKLEFTNHTLHVWFEMAAHYEQFAMQSQYWAHFFGFDNSFYYLLFIPALLKALNPAAKMPDAVITNEFLLLNGLKFSTSREHAIWADEFEGNIEHLRIYLSLVRPSQRTSDFSLEGFNHFSKELSHQLKLVSQLAETFKDNQSKFPASQQTLGDVARFNRDMDSFMELDRLDLRQAARRILGFMDSILCSCGNSANDFAKVTALVEKLKPFMPSTAETIYSALNEKKQLLNSLTVGTK